MASMEQIKNNLRTLNGKEVDVINSINEVTNAEDDNIIDGLNTMINQLGEVASSVQSDWDVNNEQSLAFIKNRPFYQDGNNIKKIDSQFLPDGLITEDRVNQKINALFTLDGTTLTITTV